MPPGVRARARFLNIDHYLIVVVWQKSSGFPVSLVFCKVESIFFAMKLGIGFVRPSSGEAYAT